MPDMPAKPAKRSRQVAFPGTPTISKASLMVWETSCTLAVHVGAGWVLPHDHPALDHQEIELDISPGSILTLYMLPEKLIREQT